MSYQLSLIEGKVGSPEKPISDLGMKGYMSYWTKSLTKLLLSYPEGTSVTLEDLSQMTCITIQVCGPRRTRHARDVASSADCLFVHRTARQLLRPPRF